MAKLTLWLQNGERPALEKTSFEFEQFKEPLVAHRGNTAGVHKSQRTFHWSPAVRALTSLLLRSAGASSTSQLPTPAQLSGLAHSPAASLDYALSKQPAWLIDIFGADARGTSIARRVLRRSNPERKRPGPVVLAINDTLLPPCAISIFLDAKEIKERETLGALALKLEDPASESHHENHQRSVTTQVSPFDCSRALYGAYRSVAGGRTLIEDFVAAQQGAGLPLAPFDQPQARSELARIYAIEVRQMLSATDVFDPQAYAATLNTINHDKIFRRVAGAKVSFAPAIERVLPRSERLGILGAPLLDRELRETSLRIVVPVDQAASISILNYLRFYRGYPLHINYSFVHSQSLLSQIHSGVLANDDFDACILSLASVAKLISNRDKGLTAAMIMPKTSRRVLVPRGAGHAAGAMSCGQYHFIHESPEGSYHYFERLCEKGAVQRRRTKVAHAEAHEAARVLRHGDTDTRAILWFPFYALNVRYNGAEFADQGFEHLGLRESVLVVTERIRRQPILMRALLSAINDGWQELRDNSEILKVMSNLLCEDRQYLRTLHRCSGLSAA